MTPILLYSINSRLAYNINKQYHNKHYVWCATKFNTNDCKSIERNNPNSSNPIEILKTYNSEIKKALTDLHTKPDFLVERINGILYGLELNGGNGDSEGLISQIKSQIENNTIWKEMKPVLYIIPYDLVKDRIKHVPPLKTAGILSDEYIIEDLLDDEFDAITDFGEIKI